MKLKYLFFAAVMTLAAGQAYADGGFSDTSIGIRDSKFVANVGSNRDVNKVIVNLQHFDIWDYGSNFFNVDVLFSDSNEPAANSSVGSTEFYAVYRAQLSPDKIFGINTKIGPFSAINFEIGGDAESENTQFAPAKKLLVAGPNFHVALPKGFLNIGVHISKEWNHNGICADACSKPGGPVNFHATPEFEFVWLYPLDFTGLPLNFQGFMNIVLPKGRDGFGARTYTEILARPQLTLDVGKMWFNKPGKPDVYLAVELWEHKFGSSTKTPGSEEVAPTIGMEVHF